MGHTLHEEAGMKSRLKHLLKDECGQDLTEYTLLMLFVVLAIIGLASGYNNNIAGVASITNSNLAAANSAAS
jgi:Flp pilus assembly pilin Flp